MSLPYNLPMAIVLFSDFGSADIYIGQIELAFHRLAPDQRIIHLFNDAPAFSPRASAHLLSALAGQLREGDVVVGVVDPGVGTARDPVVVSVDHCWFVGPDNGLFSVVAARAVSPR